MIIIDALGIHWLKMNHLFLSKLHSACQNSKVYTLQPNIQRLFQYFNTQKNCRLLKK
jgi:hypothetical protein